ncbi:MAG: (Fe-S)-binding protein [Candidatus Syntropharchaeales archaeon]
MKFVESIRIKRTMPCVADPTKIRVIASADRELGEILPYLDQRIPNALYSKKSGFLTYKRGIILITLHPTDEIAMTQIADENEANAILGEIKDKINDTYKERDQIDLTTPKKRVNVGPLDLYGYLPKTNCKECGEATCMALAVMVLNQEKSLDECPYLSEPKYKCARETLVMLLQSAGYEVN